MDKHLVKIIDNFVSPTYSDSLLNDANNYLQYYYINQTTRPGGDDYIAEAVVKDKYTFDSGQLVCPLFDSKEPHGSLKFEKYFLFVKPLTFALMDSFKELNINSALRVKTNLLLKQETFPEDHYNISHVDNIHENRWSAVYYLNDSDGDTFLFNEFFSDPVPSELTIFKRISPKKNRLVLFNSSRYHASSNPRSTPERFVINIVMNAN
jgi:hypothetical protein